MEYYLMHPPFNMKPFREMDKKAAEQHFEWFISEIPSRLLQLKELFSVTSGSDKQLLNFSPESLKLLWKWFLPLIKTVPVDQEQSVKEREHLPEWFKKHVPLETEELSTDTLALSLDVSLYFAEVFIQHHEMLRWDWIRKPKNYAYYHQPVIVGFDRMDLNPREVVRVLTSEAAEGNCNPDALYELYLVWRGFLPE